MKWWKWKMARITEGLSWTWWERSTGWLAACSTAGSRTLPRSLLSCHVSMSVLVIRVRENSSWEVNLPLFLYLFSFGLKKKVCVCAVLLPPPWIFLGFSISWELVGRYIVQCTPVLTLLTAQGMVLHPDLQLCHKITVFEGEILNCWMWSIFIVSKSSFLFSSRRNSQKLFPTCQNFLLLSVSESRLT